MTGPLPRSALALAANVLGVGALFLPWTAYAAHGGAALTGWGYQVAAGAVLVAALAAAASAPGAAQGAVPLTEAALGTAQGRALRAYYALGVTAGQVVVALVSAGFLAQALRPVLPRAATGACIGWVAAGVLVLSAVLAPSGRSLPAGLPVFGAVLVLLVAASALAGPAPAAPPAAPEVTPGGIGRAAALQFFVVVGWEAAGRLTPVTGVRRVAGPLAGVAAVGALYAGALLAAPSAGTDGSVAGLALPDLGGSGAGRVAAAALAVAAAVFCARNVRTAARLTAHLAAGPGHGTRAAAVASAAVGAVAVLGVALVRSGNLAATDVLAVPNAMACAVFLTAACACVAVTTGARRALGVAAVAGYLPLLPFLGVALLIPLAVLAAAVGSAVLAAHRGRARPRGPA